MIVSSVRCCVTQNLEQPSGALSETHVPDENKNSNKLKSKIYTISVLLTTASFALYFPSIQHSAKKKVLPLTQHISKCLLSIFEGDQELIQ